MKRRRGFRSRLPNLDPSTERGVSNALHQAFDDLEQSEDAKMQRLIEQMKNFEGSK